MVSVRNFNYFFNVFICKKRIFGAFIFYDLTISFKVELSQIFIFFRRRFIHFLELEDIRCAVFSVDDGFHVVLLLLGFWPKLQLLEALAGGLVDEHFSIDRGTGGWLLLQLFLRLARQRSKHPSDLLLCCFCSLTNL